jgi:hypothetical protein
VRVTEEEWFKKNQRFADNNGSVIYHVLAVNLNSAFQEPSAQVTLRLTDEYGSSSVLGATWGPAYSKEGPDEEAAPSCTCAPRWASAPGKPKCRPTKHIEKEEAFGPA